jgi:2,3-bisphosphoglycerate-dependent phosphoglycerate mutase
MATITKRFFIYSLPRDLYFLRNCVISHTDCLFQSWDKGNCENFLAEFPEYIRSIKMNYLVLMRHGQSQWNLENRFTGFKDVDLSDKGREEAKEAGRRIAEAGIEFDQVFTSTLQRAAHTAEIALAECGQSDLVRTMERSDAMRERDYGDLTGLNKDETKAKFGEEQVQIWRRSYDVQPPGGESLQDVVEKRVRPYFNAEIKPLLDQDENILIAAHGNSLRGVLIVLGAETPETINLAEIPTGAPLVFEMENGKILKRYYLDEKKTA